MFAIERCLAMRLDRNMNRHCRFAFAKVKKAFSWSRNSLVAFSGWGKEPLVESLTHGGVLPRSTSCCSSTNAAPMTSAGGRPSWRWSLSASWVRSGRFSTADRVAGQGGLWGLALWVVGTRWVAMDAAR